MDEPVRTIRVIVIDPKERTVTERQIEPTLRNLQEIVGGLIELVRFCDCDCNVNENGQYLREKHTFIYTDPKNGPTVPLIGTAVLFGKLTRGGRETSLKLSLEAVRQRVQFPPTLEEARAGTEIGGDFSKTRDFLNSLPMKRSED